MERLGIESLIRLAVESGDGDDPTSPDPRSAKCLSMGRLEALALSNTRPSAGESGHLSGCGLCRARFRAFVAASSAETPIELRSTCRGLRAWALRLTATAAAACVILTLLALPPAKTGTQRPFHPPFARGARPDRVRVAVCHEPAPAEAGSRRIDRFRTTCDSACLVVAVFRAWDENCQCVDWQLHEWDAEGRTLAELDEDELLDIALDVTGAPPVGQLLVVASSREPGDLPATRDEAAELLQCLNEIAPPVCTESDLSAYASAVRQCLPPHVAVVEQTFFVE